MQLKISIKYEPRHPLALLKSISIKYQQWLLQFTDYGLKCAGSLADITNTSIRYWLSVFVSM